MKKEKFVWETDKIRSYLSFESVEKRLRLGETLSKLCSKKYHDEHDIYKPFESLLSTCGLKKASKRISKTNEYLRNRKPKAFASDCGDLPDFTLRKEENFYIEIKNRLHLDKSQGDRKSPHDQMIDYLESSKVDAVGVLFNLEVLRFFIRTIGSETLVSRDYKIDQLAESHLHDILFGLISPNDAIATVEAGRLVNFVSGPSTDALTREVTSALINCYFQMLSHSGDKSAVALRQLICRVAFMFVVESRHLIARGTISNILADVGSQKDWYRKLFQFFNVGSKKYNIPKFNGRLFHQSNLGKLSPKVSSILKELITSVAEQISKAEARMSDEVPGIILELLYDVDHKNEKLKKASLISDAQKRITDRMERGTFYTGKIVSELAAAELVTGDSEWMNMKIMDLCAGSGSLLIPAVKRMAMNLSKENGWDFYTSLEHIISTNTVAVDKDAAAIELVRLNMAIDTVRFGVPLIDSSDNLITSDALEPGALKDSSADLLISNPPYLAWEKIMQKDCKIDGPKLKANSELFKHTSKPDQWYFFLEKALNVVRSGGRLAFIVPDKWIGSENSEIRSLFKETVTLEKLVHIGYPVFPDSTSTPAVVVIRNEPPSPDHFVTIESYRAQGKPATERALELRQPVVSWKLSQAELEKWIPTCIPFANESVAAKSRYETDHLPKVKELGLIVRDPRLQAKMEESQLSAKKNAANPIPVMGGRGFGEIMGYTSKKNIPETWDFVGKPALLIHQKGQFIEIEVTASCPAIWKTVTVIGCNKNVPRALFEELAAYFKSDYFREWYMMRYQTTWTQGGYQFIKAAVENYPMPRQLSKKILKYTRELIDYSAA